MPNHPRTGTCTHCSMVRTAHPGLRQPEMCVSARDSVVMTASIACSTLSTTGTPPRITIIVPTATSEPNVATAISRNASLPNANRNENKAGVGV